MNGLISVAILLSASVFLSCSVGTDPGECDRPECLPAQYNLHLTVIREEEEGGSYQELTAAAEFLKPGNRVDFYRVSDRVEPGSVSVNGFLLGPPAQEVKTFFNYIGDTLLAPPGGYNVWKVGDSDLLPPMIDSIRTPVRSPQIAAPLPTDLPSASTGFEIRVEGTMDSLAPIFLTLYQINDSGDGAEQYDTVLIANNGAGSSVPITPGLLSAHRIKAGEVRIRISQRIEQRRSIAPDIRSLMTFSTEHTVLITLAD